MRVGSLFSGIGGIELGFEREGFETKWFIENDPFCGKVLEKNYPGIPVYGDVRKIDFDKIEKVDILVGGFPCQDVSKAGKRRGLNGERSFSFKYHLARCDSEEKQFKQW